MNDGWMIIMHDRFTKDSARIEAFRDAAQKSFIALGDLEWSYDGECPECERFVARGHTDDCTLAAALGALRAVLGIV